MFRANTKEITEAAAEALGGDMVSPWDALGTLLGGCGVALGCLWTLLGCLGVLWGAPAGVGGQFGLPWGVMLLKQHACAQNFAFWNSFPESLESPESPEVVSRSAVQVSPSTRARWSG